MNVRSPPRAASNTAAVIVKTADPDNFRAEESEEPDEVVLVPGVVPVALPLRKKAAVMSSQRKREKSV